MIKTKEGGTQFEFTGNHAVEFFSKAGSLFTKTSPFYEGNESALSLFQKVWCYDKELALKLLMWLRDCRGGAGNRSASREIYSWLGTHTTGNKWINANIESLINLGRWDDLRSLFSTYCHETAVKKWAEAIHNENVLAAKWAKREDTPLRRYLKLNEAEFRKLLASIRSKRIVESKMCAKDWKEIEYSHVPSVAMSRYTNAFKRNDTERFEQYKTDVKSGVKEIKASVLFPHDCVRTALNGDYEVADLQFDALPNYLNGVNDRIIVISDTSGSMDSVISGSVKAIHISQGMALYCSAKIPENNPFYKKFIGFCSEGQFRNWKDLTFSEAVRSRHIFDHAIGSTRIDKALDLIYSTAKFFNLNNDQMPNVLLIVSDMQFHQGTTEYNSWGDRGKRDVKSEVQKSLDKWKKAGYNIPKIVYWNTAGYAGSPDTIDNNNIALVSGFSPSILKSIFSGDDFSPEVVMMRTLEKYTVNIPN